MFTWSSGAGGYTVGGSADFSTVPDGSEFDLVIVVNNNATVGVSSSSEILTGLYFNITGPSQAALEMMSAVAEDGLIETGNYTGAADGTAGSNICAPGAGGAAPGPGCSSTVAGGWESGFWSSGTNGYNYGIGTSGFSGAFDGNGTKGAGQVNYGIVPLATSASPALAEPKSGVTKEFPYVDGTATFVLGGLTSSQIAIADVEAVYGTSSNNSVTAAEEFPKNQSKVNGAPEPATIFEVSGATIMICGWFWRKNRRIPRA